MEEEIVSLYNLRNYGFKEMLEDRNVMNTLSSVNRLDGIGWKCVNTELPGVKDCIQVEGGQYDTQQECLDNCPPTGTEPTEPTEPTIPPTNCPVPPCPSGCTSTEYNISGRCVNRGILIFSGLVIAFLIADKKIKL